jgi:hypothetical protein
MFTTWRPVPGLPVPVLVSADMATVTIDWDSFVQRGGIDRAATLMREHQAARSPAQGAAETGKMLAKRPKLAAQQRGMALSLGPEMAAQVPAGIRPAHEFAQWVSGLVQGGALSAEEGDDLLRQAGLAPPHG